MRQYGSIFFHLAVVASQICEIMWNSEKFQAYSISRTSKVIDLGANQKCTCDFLLVISSNFEGILYGFCHNGATSQNSFPTPPLLEAMKSPLRDLLEVLDKIYPNYQN